MIGDFTILSSPLRHVNLIYNVIVKHGIANDILIIPVLKQMAMFVDITKCLCVQYVV